MSAKFYEALEAKGHDESKKAFAPGDNSHHNNYGGYELAKCIVQGIKERKLDSANQIVPDWKPFDPAHPDALTDFQMLSADATVTAPKPDGN